MRKWLYIVSACCLTAVFFSCSSGVDATDGITLTDGSGVVITAGQAIAVGESLDICVSGVNERLSPDDPVSMVCYDSDEDVDGEAVEIETTFNENNTCLSIVPVSGEFPQNKRCVLTYGTVDWSLTTGCSVNDDFSDPNTLDLTAASLERGTGCWDISFEELAPNDYSIGSLRMDFTDGWGFVYKRIRGDNYTVFMDTQSLAYDMDPALVFGDDNGTNVGLVITDSAVNLITGLSANLSSVSFGTKDVNPGGLYFQCEASVELEPSSIDTFDSIAGCGGITLTADAGTLTDLPVIGFIKSGATAIPYYSFDATPEHPSGVTKNTFTLLGSAAVDITDFSGGTDEIEIMISGAPQGDTSLGEVIINSFTIEGDATFVE